MRVPSGRPSHTRLLLTGPYQEQYATTARDNGQFTLSALAHLHARPRWLRMQLWLTPVSRLSILLSHNVPAGQYILEAQNIDYTFSLVSHHTQVPHGDSPPSQPSRLSHRPPLYPALCPSQYRVDISSVRDKISITLHTPASLLNPTQPATRTGYPLTLTPIAHNTYFQHREPFSPLSLLKQPMALMMLFMLVMVIAVPRMMGGMSDEEKREMAQMQQTMSLQGLLGKMEKKANEVKESTGRDRRLRD